MLEAHGCTQSMGHGGHSSVRWVNQWMTVSLEEWLLLKTGGKLHVY